MAQQVLLQSLIGLGLRSARRNAYTRSSAAWGLSETTYRSFSNHSDKSAQNSLLSHIKTKILMRGGPISMAEYMQDCLTSPQGGFYMNRDVFGRAGDFVTSPEISQLFGEMVGIWCVHTWMAMGRPPRLHLVEMGPGRGTLMADLLRGTAAFRDFAAALEIHLVEVSPALRQLQAEALKCEPLVRQASNPTHQPTQSPPTQRPLAPAQRQPPLRQELPFGSQPAASGGPSPAATAVGYPPSSPASSPCSPTSPSLSSSGPPERAVCGLNGCQVTWHASLDAVPDGPAPALYIAHEFFDALPVHQFVRDTKRGWLEKMVDVAQSGDGEADGSTRESNTLTAATESTAADIGSGSLRSSVDGGGGGVGGPSHSMSGSGLRLVLSPGPTPAAALLVPRRLAGLAKEEAEGVKAIEVSAVGMATAERLALRIGRHGGAALIVDYGRDRPPYEDSLMAIRAHRGVGILDGPGTADLSAWVDFGALRLAALGAHRPAESPTTTSLASSLSSTTTNNNSPPTSALSPSPPTLSPPASTPGGPVSTSGPVTQSAFLRSLGIETRLRWLLGRATSGQQAEALVAGCERLLGGGEEGMGVSYKVMAIHQAGLRELAGLGPGAGEGGAGEGGAA